MSRQMEEMLRRYPQMVTERRCLEEQIAHFRGASVRDVFDSMYTPNAEGERVQTSGTSDKTAQIAMSYQERRDNINADWWRHLEWRLNCLLDQLTFLESALHALPEPMGSVMWDLVIGQMKWETVEKKYSMSHATVFRERRRAIAELDRMYQEHMKALAEYMLQ